MVPRSSPFKPSPLAWLFSVAAILLVLVFSLLSCPTSLELIGSRLLLALFVGGFFLCSLPSRMAESRFPSWIVISLIFGGIYLFNPLIQLPTSNCDRPAFVGDLPEIMLFWAPQEIPSDFAEKSVFQAIDRHLLVQEMAFRRSFLNWKSSQRATLLADVQQWPIKANRLMPLIPVDPTTPVSQETAGFVNQPASMGRVSLYRSEKDALQLALLNEAETTAELSEFHLLDSTHVVVDVQYQNSWRILWLYLPASSDADELPLDVDVRDVSSLVQFEANERFWFGKQGEVWTLDSISKPQ